MPQVADWQERHRQPLVITVISRGDPSTKRAKAADFGVRCLLQKDSEIADKFAIAGFPSAVLVGADGTIASAAAAGTEASAPLSHCHHVRFHRPPCGHIRNRHGRTGFHAA